MIRMGKEEGRAEGAAAQKAEDEKIIASKNAELAQLKKEIQRLQTQLGNRGARLPV